MLPEAQTALCWSMEDSLDTPHSGPTRCSALFPWDLVLSAPLA